MGHRIEKTDLGGRPLEKEASRERDCRSLKAGEIAPQELARKNFFFRSLPLHRFEMVAIGGKPLPGRGAPRESKRVERDGGDG